MFVSPDLKHSTAFIQHAMDILIQEYKARFTAEGRTLEHVHLWSDGCAGQFKNRQQFYWVAMGRARYNVRITHNFFQSCHGKGPSDSEGAVCKSGLRKAEFVLFQYVSLPPLLS